MKNDGNFHMTVTEDVPQGLILSVLVEAKMSGYNY